MNVRRRAILESLLVFLPVACASRIDLLVPYCGDYTEASAWTKAERKMYQNFLNERHMLKAAEYENRDD